MVQKYTFMLAPPQTTHLLLRRLLILISRYLIANKSDEVRSHASLVLTMQRYICTTWLFRDQQENQTGPRSDTYKIGMQYRWRIMNQRDVLIIIVCRDIGRRPVHDRNTHKMPTWQRNNIKSQETSTEISGFTKQMIPLQWKYSSTVRHHSKAHNGILPTEYAATALTDSQDNTP